MYLPATPDEPFAQGDIFDECPVYRANGTTPDHFLARVIVLTQTCDFANGKANRPVVAVVHEAAELVNLGEVKANAVRDQIRRGFSFGYYFLPAGTEPVILPESLVDIRDLHSIPLAVLDELAARGKRIARLAVPYREHLAQHFAVSYMRIALPAQYPTAP